MPLSPPSPRPALSSPAFPEAAGKRSSRLGLARALTLRGLRVKPCKKGPDYIDAAWLGLASGRTPTNLDPFFLTDARLRALFCTSFGDADLAIIEGNRGLYDGATCRGAAPPRHSPALLRARPAHPHGHQDDPHRRRGHCRAGPLRTRQSRGRCSQPRGFLAARRPHPAKHRNIHRYPRPRGNPPACRKSHSRAAHGARFHARRNSGRSGPGLPARRPRLPCRAY